MLRFVLSLSALMLVAPPAAVAVQWPGTPGVYARPPAPGQMVEVDEGRRLHILCKGSGEGTTVIFEAGLSQYTANSTYGAAQDAIAPFARVCTYDRAGLGWSDPAPEGWTQEGMVRDLHRLLGAAQLPRPYIIVGHSLGGLLARTYARTYPGEVAGLVLVDATTERDFPGFDAARASVVAQIDSALVGARPGVPVVGLPLGTSPETALSFTPEVLRGVKVEFQALERLPAAMRQPDGSRTLGDLPLIVVRRGKTAQPPSPEDEAHRVGQEALARLSTNSTLVVAENSGHAVVLDEPQVLAGAVRRMMEALRNHAPRF